MGQFRYGRTGELRIGRHQIVHAFLGAVNVRIVQCDQRYRSVELAHCHDVEFICNDNGKGTRIELCVHIEYLTHLFRNIPIPNGNLLVLNCG